MRPTRGLRIAQRLAGAIRLSVDAMRLARAPAARLWDKAPPSRSTQMRWHRYLGERASAIEMLTKLSGPLRCTVGADKAYEARGFVARTRELNVTVHVAQNIE
jgi:hypothetical protein